MIHEFMEINDVYSKVENVLNLRIKAQLRGTSIIFEKFYHTTDLLTNEKSYCLVVNQNVIWFTSTELLCKQLLKIIENVDKSLKEEIVKMEFYYNNNINPTPFNVREHLSELGDKEYRLSKLNEKINEIMSSCTIKKF